MKSFKYLMLFLLVILLKEMYGQSRTTVHSMWADDTLTYYKTNPVSFVTDTLIIAPAPCFKKPFGWICCATINRNRYYGGITFENDIFKRFPEGNSQLGLLLGHNTVRNSSLKALLEIHYSKSINAKRQMAGLAYHRTIVFRKFYNRLKVPKIMLGSMVGYTKETNVYNPFIKPQLSYVLPKARAFIYLSHQFNKKNTFQTRYYNGFSFGLKVTF